MLVRHGQTDWNLAGLWQGHADRQLTDVGRAQAKALAEELVVQREADARAGLPDFDHIWVSDLSRARETAEFVAAALDLRISTDQRLRELDVGAWSGMPRADIHARDERDLLAFEAGDPAIRAGGGESRIQIRQRAHAFVEARAEDSDGQRLIVVTHLGVIRALLPGAEPTNAERFEVHAQEILDRGVDHSRRPEDGAL
ncbi:MAG: histidine phosphatase family protein [Myxococcota bacterium]